MRPPEFNTEQKILDAAITIFVRYGFYGITLQQIAKKAGVNKSAIHYYFRSKEKLYKKVLMEIIQVIESDEWNLRFIKTISSLPYSFCKHIAKAAQANAIS